MSYSQIKALVGVSKGTLSSWLSDFPLPPERIRELRDRSAIRIERCRETKARKREERLIQVRRKVMCDIGNISSRESFLAGLFLYWGEGTKTRRGHVSVSNTDPAVLLFFKNWLLALGAEEHRLRVRIQIYADMNPEDEIRYWSQILNIPTENFRKPYIKASNRLGLTYVQRFTHGTCNLLYDSRDLGEYVHCSLEYVRGLFVAEED